MNDLPLRIKLLYCEWTMSFEMMEIHFLNMQSQKGVP